MRQVLVRCLATHTVMRRARSPSPENPRSARAVAITLGGRRPQAPRWHDQGTPPGASRDDRHHGPGLASGLQRSSSRRAPGHRNPRVPVCGTATIGGYRCAIFVMNGEFMMGSMGSVRREDLSPPLRSWQPRGARLVVASPCRGGARMQEGTTPSCRWPRPIRVPSAHSDRNL